MSGKARLVVLSFLMLFVELALIRWTGSNILYLSYFANFVLLGSFLGIGLGFLRANRSPDLFRYAASGLTFLVIFVLGFPVSIDRSGAQLIFFGAQGPTGLPIWVTLPVIFLVVAGVMATIAQEVGRTFSRFRPLEAYRLDIVGSLAGIAVFSAMSFLGAPPVAWGAVVGAVLLVLYRPGIRLVEIVSVTLLVGLLGLESLASGALWSPYYKVTHTETSPGEIQVFVNGIPHQTILSVSARRRQTPIYFLPYRRVGSNPLRDVLVVGAGTGSDVAIALAEGAHHVDAVEIDPRIYRLGVDLNPDRPFQDRRVTLHVDDGRAFLERSNERYDLILFALPDSLTLIAGQSSLRLESYLFTREAIQATRAHLRPGGAFAMYNLYRQRWLVDRLASTVRSVYGHAPCIDQVGRVGHLDLITVGRERQDVSCDRVWRSGPDASPDALRPATDDHPFLYLLGRSIPAFYLLTIALIMLASLVLIRAASGSVRRMTAYTDLFFMGAAFLLLETKSVVQFALLFGTTWFVNALVFGGILLSVLGAIEVARRVRVQRVGPLYLTLFAALAAAWIVPASALLGLAPPARFAAAVALAFAPVFLANVIFAERFRDVESSTVAFATNLLGAMVGGILEYASLVSGYRALLPVIGALYGAAFLTRGRRVTPEPQTAPRTEVLTPTA
jgi:hypothetical protein